MTDYERHEHSWEWDTTHDRIRCGACGTQLYWDQGLGRWEPLCAEPPTGEPEISIPELGDGYRSPWEPYHRQSTHLALAEAIKYLHDKGLLIKWWREYIEQDGRDEILASILWALTARNIAVKEGEGGECRMADNEGAALLLAVWMKVADELAEALVRRHEHDSYQPDCHACDALAVLKRVECGDCGSDYLVPSDPHITPPETGPEAAHIDGRADA
jgi:hypothetical protein